MDGLGYFPHRSFGRKSFNGNLVVFLIRSFITRLKNFSSLFSSLSSWHEGRELGVHLGCLLVTILRICLQAYSLVLVLHPIPAWLLLFSTLSLWILGFGSSRSSSAANYLSECFWNTLSIIVVSFLLQSGFDSLGFGIQICIPIPRVQRDFFRTLSFSSLSFSTLSNLPPVHHS